MKYKKRLFFVATILLIILLVLHFFEIEKSKENKSITSINVNNIQNIDQAQKVLWNNSKYYFYDQTQKGIVSYSDLGHEEKLFEIDECTAICGNEDNLFCVDGKRLYQYNLKEKTLVYEDVMFLQTEDIQIGVMGNQIYIFGEGIVCLFSAQNIQEKNQILIKNNKEYTKENDYMISILEGEEEVLYLLQDYNYDSKKEDLRIRKTETYTMIYTVDGDLDLSMLLIDKETGEKVIGNCGMLGVDEKKLIECKEGVILYQDNKREGLVNDDVTYGEYGADYMMSNSVIKEGILIIQASSYESTDLTLNEGTLKQHESDNLWYVDLKNKSTLRNYCFDKGEIIWYADNEQYILFKDGELITYDAYTQKELCRKNAKWFEKDSNYQYEVILCHDKWFVFNEEMLVDIVPMEAYLK